MGAFERRFKRAIRIGACRTGVGFEPTNDGSQSVAFTAWLYLNGGGGRFELTPNPGWSGFTVRRVSHSATPPANIKISYSDILQQFEGMQWICQ